eukprot:Gb_17225 [translate_table: standard]
MRMRHGHHNGFRNRLRMGVEHGFHLHTVDVLPTEDDDVFESILDLNVVIGVNDVDIVGVEPAVSKSLIATVGVIEISLHDAAASHHHFAHGVTIVGNAGHASRLFHVHLLQAHHANALPPFHATEFPHIQPVPI